MKDSLFGELLIAWFQENGRQLPWRETTDPYKIWISEIILQQTRVVQGLDYYRRFVARFPDVHALAEASEDEVLRYWEGLGYYTRARNMLKAAKRIVQMPDFPRDYATLLTLNGIGEYTASAIASFSSNEAVAVVDGNVYRVLSRFCCDRTPIDTGEGKKRFRSLAGHFLLKDQSAVYNQAIMDFGAMVCTPRAPQCSACPVASYCLALKEDMVNELPVKARKTQQTLRYMTFVEVYNPQNGWLLHKRTSKDIWRGLHEPVLLESDHQMSCSEVKHSEALRPFISDGQDSQLTLVAERVKHVLTHRVIWADYYILKTTADACPSGYFFTKKVDSYAVPVLLKQLRVLLKES